VPTANSAAGRQPIPNSHILARPASAPGLRTALLGLALSVSTLLPAGLVLAPSVLGSASPDGSGACRRHTSTTTPPAYIYVYRNQSGRVVKVAFKKYVITVMGKEWPAYLPHAVVEAGAVAVKQYAWFHVLQGPRRTRDGRCYDVRDGTSDQLYKPNRARVRSDHYAAVEKTWQIVLTKNDRFFMTGYRRGDKHRCGRDRTGWKLFARSATRCANAGKRYQKILRIYYGPNLQVKGETQAASYRSEQ
jgi:peptidoglycan hydrolase-like amidase